MSYLYKKILAQPKEFRRRLTFAITAFLGIIMFSLWLIVTSSSFKKITDDFDSEETKNLVPSIKDSFSQTINNLDEISESQTKNEENNIQTEPSPIPIVNPAENPITTDTPAHAQNSSEDSLEHSALNDDHLLLEKSKPSPSPSPVKATTLIDIN